VIFFGGGLGGFWGFFLGLCVFLGLGGGGGRRVFLFWCWPQRNSVSEPEQNALAGRVAGREAIIGV